jgi:hypothetical protein
MLRSFELTAGLAAGLLGLIGLTYALFGQTGTYITTTGTSSGSTTTTTGTTSLVEQGLHPIAMLFITLMLLCVVGVAVGAYLHSQQGRRGGLWLLWVATALLAVGVLVSGLSIGLFLLPAALLALLAACLGSGVPLRRERAG